MAMDGDRDDSVSQWSVENGGGGGGVPSSQVLSTRSIDDPAKVEAMVTRMREAKESGAIEVLTKIKHFMHERRIRVEDIFTRSGFDKSGDGKLDEGEFRVALERLGMGQLTNPEIRKVFDFFDKDHDDLIEEDELELALHQLRQDVKRLQDLERESKPGGQRHGGDDKSTTAAMMLDLTSAINRDRGEIIKGVSSVASYRSEGDKQMYTTANLVKRKRLRESQVVAFWLDQYWNTLGPELTGGVEGAVDQWTMQKGVYTLLFTKIAKVLLEPEAFNEGAVRAANAKDWEREFGLQASTINHKQFKNSIFETIDIWTAGATEEEYTFFASELFVRITCGNAKDREMRDMKDINHWSEDDRDLKKKQRATDESVSSWQSRGESSAQNDIKAIMKEEEARKLAAECMATVKAHIGSGDQPRSLRNIWKVLTDKPLNERRLNALLGAVAEDARSEYERLLRKKGVPRDAWQQAELDAWIQEKTAQIRDLNERRRAECMAVEEKARKKIKVVLRQDTADYLRGQDESDVNKAAESDMPSPHKPAIHVRTDPAVGNKQQRNEGAAPSMSPIPGATPPVSPAVASPASPRKRLSQRTTSALDTATTTFSVVDGEAGAGSRKLEYAEASDDQSIMSMDISLGGSAKHRHQREKFFESPKVEGRKKKADFFPAELVAEWRMKYTEMYRKETKGLPEDIADIEVFERWFARELDLIRREEIENAKRKSKVQTSGIRVSSLGAQSKEADPDWLHYHLDIDVPTEPHVSVDSSNLKDIIDRPSTQPQAQSAPRRFLEPTIRWIRNARELPGHALAPPLSPRTPEDLKFGPNARPRVATPLDDLAIALHMDQVQRGSVRSIALPNTTGYGQETWNVRPSTTELKTFGYSAVAQPIIVPKEPSPNQSTRQREASDRRAANDWLEMRTYNSSAGNGTAVPKEQQVVASAAGENEEAGGSNLLDNWSALEQGTESRRSKQDQRPFFDSSSQVRAEIASTFHMSMVSSIISESERSGDSEDSDEDPLDLLDAVDIYGLMDSVEHLKMGNSGPRNVNNYLDDVKMQARFIAQATVVDTVAAIKQAAIAPFSKAQRIRRGHRYNGKGEVDIIDPVATAARSLSVKSRVLMKRGRSLLRKERTLFDPRRQPTSPPAKAQRAVAVATGPAALQEGRAGGGVGVGVGSLRI